MRYVDLTKDKPFEAEEVTHGSNSKIVHDVHASGMNIIYRPSPVIYCTPVRIQNSQIQRGIT
jgi:hypothetical protein